MCGYIINIYLNILLSRIYSLKNVLKLGQQTIVTCVLRITNGTHSTSSYSLPILLLVPIPIK